MHDLRNVDFHAESTLDIVKTLSFFRSFYQACGWRFAAWVEEALGIYWPQISSDHDDVRPFVALVCDTVVTIGVGAFVHQRPAFIFQQSYGEVL